MRRRRSLNQNNSGAIADVSFLLLIFFMVATTFNKDYKLEMQLPPFAETQTKGSVNKNRLLKLLINGENEIMIDNQRVQDDLTQQLIVAIESITASKKDGIVQIQMHPNTDYQHYIELLAHINEAKNELRIQKANRIFKKEYIMLPVEKRKQIDASLKFRISELETTGL